MAVKLNQTAYELATRLVTEGSFVADERDDWSEHQPSAQEEDEFIDEARSCGVLSAESRAGQRKYFDILPRTGTA